MQLDTSKTFEEIYKGDPGLALRQLLLSLREPRFTLRRENTQKWASNLRFICVPKNIAPLERKDNRNEALGGEESSGLLEEFSDNSIYEDSDSANDSSEELLCTCNGREGFSEENNGCLQITDAGKFPGCIHYVAVSYCWSYPSPSSGILQRLIGRLKSLLYTIVSTVALVIYWLLGREFRWLFVEQPCIVQTGSGLRKSRAPREILDRVMKYAVSEGVQLVWIDQECIDQDDRLDKELGIQSMDLVYQYAQHPIGLLNVCITTQIHMDAFLQLVNGEEFTATEFEAAVEVLELLAGDRWLTRAWVYQEVAAAGDKMELLIRCDPELEKSIYLGRVSGEITITIEQLVNCLGLVAACVETREDLSTPLKIRAKQATEYLFKLAPSWGRSSSDPEFRFGCNGLQAFKFLSGRENSIVSDRLAILGNICNYAIRLNTNEFNTNSYSFSACAFALALLNGDISFIIGYTPTYNEINQIIDHSSNSSTLDRRSRPFSWTPPPSVCFTTLHHFEENDTSYCRISSQIHNMGLVVSGWLWKIDTPIHLPNVQAQYSQLWSCIPNPETRMFDDSPESAGRIAKLILWSAIRELVEAGHIKLAQTIWDSNQNNFVPNTEKQHQCAIKIPVDITSIIDPTTHQFIFNLPPYINSESDAHKLLCSVSLKGYGFIIRRILDEGMLWCGDNAIFDVDGPNHVLLPKAEGMDVSPRPTFFRMPMAWRVKLTKRFEDHIQILDGTGMVTGQWVVGNEEVETFIVA